MSQADLSIGSDQIYTMRELNQDTAGVLRKINESGRPGIITRHGRFVAMVTPLVGRNIENAALSMLVDESLGIPAAQGRGAAVAENLTDIDEVEISGNA